MDTPQQFSIMFKVAQNNYIEFMQMNGRRVCSNLLLTTKNDRRYILFFTSASIFLNHKLYRQKYFTGINMLDVRKSGLHITSTFMYLSSNPMQLWMKTLILEIPERVFLFIKDQFKQKRLFEMISYIFISNQKL